MDAPVKQSVTTGKLTPSYIEVILIVLLITCSLLYGYDRYVAQKVRVVDMGSYLRQQKALLVTGELSADELKEGLDRIDQLVRQEAELHPNHIYLLKEVVLHNGEELDLD